MRLRALYYRFLGYKTIEELMAELTAGKRNQIDEKEIIHGRLLGIALLPRGLRYPKKGEMWETIDDFKIHYMTAHHAAFTGGGEAILSRGECVICWSDATPPFVGAYFDPVRYDALHNQIVPEKERQDPYYSRYYFSIDTVDLNQYFRWVSG